MDGRVTRGLPAPALDDATYADLVRAMLDRIPVHAPDWGGEESDPGVALVELFAFLAETLLARADALPGRGRLAAGRLAEFARALAERGGGAAACALERPRYFAGQILGAEDFALEQDYVRFRLRRLNRELHGAGVVRGLGVSLEPGPPSAAGAVVVAPGFALTPSGEEVEVCDAQRRPLPAAGATLYVLLAHAERPTRPVPVAGGEGVEFTRVEEGFAIRLSAEAAGEAVALARLVREEVLVAHRPDVRARPGGPAPAAVTTARQGARGGSLVGGSRGRGSRAGASRAGVLLPKIRKLR